jgi:hypothetical protein
MVCGAAYLYRLSELASPSQMYLPVREVRRGKKTKTG